MWRSSCPGGGWLPTSTSTPSWPPRSTPAVTQSIPATGSCPRTPSWLAAAPTPAWLFIGPSPEALDLFGDKGRARAAAADAGVPVLAGFDRAVSLDEARDFLDLLGPGGAVMVKAVAGGGGRGSRAVESLDALDEAWERCRSEAEGAFGNGDLYVEQLVVRARHLEVQVVADHAGGVTHLGERECSAQRRHQKIVELAPAIGLDDATRSALHDHAVRLAASTGYRSLGTFEFLLDADRGELAFIEANARLQVEHTVTEEVTGIDLVQTQIRLADGATPGRGRPRSARRAPGVCGAGPGSTWRRWRPTARCGRPVGWWRPTSHRVGQGSGSTGTATPAIRPARPTTPCWPR